MAFHPFTAVKAVPYLSSRDAAGEGLLGAQKSIQASARYAANFNSKDVQQDGSNLLASVLAIFTLVLAFKLARCTSSSLHESFGSRSNLFYFSLGVFSATLLVAFVLAIWMYCGGHLLDFIMSYYNILSTIIFHSTAERMLKVQWSLISRKTEWLALCRSGVIVDAFELCGPKGRYETWVVEFVSN